MFQCDECGKQYTQRKSLYRHIRKDHDPNFEATKEAFSKESYSYICDECGKSFLIKCKLISHIKEHNASGIRRQKISCCMCSDTFPRYQQYEDHLSCTHGIVINRKDLQFQNNQAFLEWKENMQSSLGLCYVKERAPSSSKDGKVEYYRCHRSYEPSIKTGRRTKYLGSNKIGAACPSRITVRHLPDIISVNYVETHVGHECDIGRVPLTLTEKMTIVGKMKQGVPFHRILEDIRLMAENKDTVQRIHLVDTKTLHDIRREFNINSEQRHSNDSVSVNIWVKEMEQLGDKNPVLYFKDQDSNTGDDNIFEEKDFVLIIMTPFQQKMLTAFGNDAILIDGTHGMNGYDFYLYTLFVLDEFRNGIPVAFCFSNREDTKLFEHYFGCVKERVGEIHSKIFMSDGAEVFYNAWSLVMGAVELRLLCIWHVFKNWTENSARYIKNTEKRIWVMNVLHTLVYEVDAKNLEFELDSFLSRLFEDADTESFGGYFKRGWADKFQQWAMCHREYCGLNTNMTLEAIHKLLKYSYLGGVQCRRLDRGIQACMKLAFDAKFKRLIKLKRNRATEKLRRIHASHEKSQKSEFVVSLKDTNDNYNWLVHSESEEGKLYEVIQVVNVCVENYCALKCEACDTCIHMYLCQCKDNVQRFNICKHIHAVASQLKKSSPIIDGKENDTNVPTNSNMKVQEIFEIMDSPLIKNDEDLSEQILGKAKRILELSRDKLIPIENRKLVNGLLDKALLKICAENWTEPMIAGSNNASIQTTPTHNHADDASGLYLTTKATRPKKLEKQKRFYSTKKARKKKEPFSMKKFAISEVHSSHILNSLHNDSLSIISKENIEHSYY